MCCAHANTLRDPWSAYRELTPLPGGHKPVLQIRIAQLTAFLCVLLQQPIQEEGSFLITIWTGGASHRLGFTRHSLLKGRNLKPKSDFLPPGQSLTWKANGAIAQWRKTIRRGDTHVQWSSLLLYRELPLPTHCISVSPTCCATCKGNDVTRRDVIMLSDGACSYKRCKLLALPRNTACRWS